MVVTKQRMEWRNENASARNETKTESNKNKECLLLEMKQQPVVLIHCTQLIPHRSNKLIIKKEH